MYGLAFPIIGGMISQNVLNLVDTAMVGVLGDEALAAVGMGSFLNFMAGAFVTGMAAGVQAMSAHWRGAGRSEETALPLTAALLLACGFALPAAFILIGLAPSAYGLLGLSPEVAVLGIPYLQIRLVAMPGLGMNFAFRGYWAAVSLTRFYLRTLLVMHGCNILLNWLLIFGRLGFPELGVRGAALGTTLSTYLGTALYLTLALRHARAAGFLRAWPVRELLGRLLRLSLPAGLQSFGFATGMTALFWILGRLGTAELAAANVLTNLTLLGILPLIGFGLATGSLVGQELGRGDVAAAERWGWEVSTLAMLGMGLLALPVAVFPDAVLGLFLHEPATRELARVPLRLIASLLGLDALGTVLLHAHLGAGDSRRVMLVSFTLQWGLFLPSAFLIGPVLGHGLLEIWIANLAYRGLQALVFACSWRRGGWRRIRL
ncbi:MAG: MATE family efflux transporter [Myxococcota bacterium]